MPELLKAEIALKAPTHLSNQLTGMRSASSNNVQGIRSIRLYGIRTIPGNISPQTKAA